jgi:hypothetical protein
MPPDVRKGFAFPSELLVVRERLCLDHSNWRRSLQTYQVLNGKAEPYRTSGGTAANEALAARNLPHRFNQSLDLVIAGIAGTTHAHETFGLKTQSLNHRRRVKIAV